MIWMRALITVVETIAVTLLILCLFLLTMSYTNTYEEDVYLTTPQLIEKYGYPAEIHEVTTRDGYKLALHRIPHGKNLLGSSSTTGIPVLITHSLVCNSATWVDNLNESLGFILADENFDVWLANFRGNSYTSHSSYSNSDLEFWDYSAEDMAEHDLPTFIDYVQNITGHPKILYIGQSLGTTVGFYLFASKPEYNDKVAGFVALAPVAHVAYMPSPSFNFLQNNMNILLPILKTFRSGRIIYPPPIIHKIYFTLCSAANFCDSSIYWWAGYNPYNLNSTRFPVYATHCGDGTSIKTALLYNQQSVYKTISRFDYGKAENLKRFGEENPPVYNISAITVPVAIFSARNDPLSTPLDIPILIRQLKTKVSHEIMPDPMFNHVNFIWLRNAKEALYGKVIQELRNMWRVVLGPD